MHHRFACALICLFSIAACADLRPLDPPAVAEGILHGPVDAAEIDFGSSVFEPSGPNAVALANIATRIKTVIESGKAPCSPEFLNALAARPWIELAILAADESSWRDANAALKSRYHELELAAVGLSHGREPLDARARNVAIDMILANLIAEQNPRARELHARTVVDQLYRFAGAQWQTGLSKAASDQWSAVVSARISRESCDNTKWMRAQLARIDWFTIPVYGEQADAAAWVLVQHADYDREFQHDVLKRLERLERSGGTTGRNVAYLSDRLAVAEGRPQRFGTQVQCRNGKWEIILGVERAETLDTSRKQFGLPAWAQYAAKLGDCIAR